MPLYLNAFKHFAKPWESKLGGCPYLKNIDEYPICWKKFHDGVKEHWDFVINHLLPKHEVII